MANLPSDAELYRQVDAAQESIATLEGECAALRERAAELERGWADNERRLKSRPSVVIDMATSDKTEYERQLSAANARVAELEGHLAGHKKTIEALSIPKEAAEHPLAKMDQAIIVGLRKQVVRLAASLDDCATRLETCALFGGSAKYVVDELIKPFRAALAESKK